MIDTNDHPIHLSNNLRVLRKAKRKSQQDVADAIGIKRSSYSGYENGTSEPDLSTLLRLCHYYKVAMGDLIATDLEALSTTALSVLHFVFEQRVKPVEV